MNAPNQITELKKELADIRKDLNKVLNDKRVSGVGGLSLSNKVLTVDRTVNISDIMNRIAAAEARLDSMQDLSTEATPTFGGLIIPAFGNGLIKVAAGGLLSSSALTAEECAAAVSGTTNYLAKFTGANKVGNSAWLAENGTGVGIGTTSPVDKLTIRTVPDDANAISGTASITPGHSYGLSLLAGTTSSDRCAQFYNAGGTTPYLYIRGDGLVGIGTASPKSPLHVVGLPSYATNAAAITGGLTAGAFYILTGTGSVMVVV